MVEHCFKRKTQHWPKFHVRLQLKMMLGLTKCAWQVWFKDCSLNFPYTELMAQKGSDLCATLCTITGPQTSEQSTTENILRGTVSGHVKVPQSSKNSQRFFELMILPFSLYMEEGTESPWMKPTKNVLQTQELQNCRPLQESQLCEIECSKYRHLWTFFSDLHPSHKSQPCLCKTEIPLSSRREDLRCWKPYCNTQTSILCSSCPFISVMAIFVSPTTI